MAPLMSAMDDDGNLFEVERDGDEVRIWKNAGWPIQKVMTIPASLAAQIAAALVRVDRPEPITASVAGAVRLSDAVKAA